MRFPAQIIPMWFKPIKTGTYEIVCGQLCGLGHYSMKGHVVVDAPADYQAWLKERLELSRRHAPRRADRHRRATGRPTPGIQSRCSRRSGDRASQASPAAPNRANRRQHQSCTAKTSPHCFVAAT